MKWQKKTFDFVRPIMCFLIEKLLFFPPSCQICEIGCSKGILCSFFSLQAISFLTPLAVIFVVKIIQRTDKTEIKEACLGEYPKDTVNKDNVHH